MNKMHNGRVDFEPVGAVADVGLPLQGYASNQATLAASGIASENRWLDWVTAGADETDGGSSRLDGWLNGGETTSPNSSVGLEEPAATAEMDASIGTESRAGVGVIPFLPALLLDWLLSPEDSSDTEELTEDEIAAYADEQVEVCSDPFIPGGDHWWLKVGDREVGMNRSVGAGSQGMPTLGNEADASPIHTEWVDHDGRSRMVDEDKRPIANCTPASERDERWSNVDPACVVRETPIGGELGYYARLRPGEPNLGPDGFLYHCQAAAAEVLDACGSWSE